MTNERGCGAVQSAAAAPSRELAAGVRTAVAEADSGVGAAVADAVTAAADGRRTDAAAAATDGCCADAAAGRRMCTCRYKETERSREFQNELTRRLNRAIGQLNGVRGMIDDNRYCGDVLTQLAAAERAVHTVSAMLLKDHLETCVIERVRRGDDAVIDEAMQLIKRFAR